MLIRPFVDESLGNSSYLIASEESGLAAVIDPQRDVDRYVQTAEGLGLRLVYALDTHVHNDFVSGARELAARIGLRAVAGTEFGLEFEHLAVNEGDTLSLGDLRLGVMATPGHTPEHISFTLHIDAAPPSAIFTGGALIAGGAARTDLLGDEHSVPLARHLYRTIHHKLLTLPDAVNVYPTHGAGSFCAAPVSAERVTTIGRERSANPLALSRSEQEFVERSLRGLPSYPVYYKSVRLMNRRGPQILGGLPMPKPMPPDEVAEWLGQGGAVLDVRPAAGFWAGHIPNAYGIPLSTPLVTWAGWLIPFGTPLVLVSTDASDREEALRQLIRIGFDDVRGYLDGGLPAWTAAARPIARVPTVSIADLRERLGDGERLTVLDVRHNSEWIAGHIHGAIHVENGRLPYDALPLPQDSPVAIHCQHGDRSTAGCSILARRGYRQVILVEGGFHAWLKAGYPVERG